MAAAVVSPPSLNEESKENLSSTSVPAADSTALPAAQTDKAKLSLSGEHKDAGNKAFAAGRHTEAVTSFSSAITLDPTNAVLYSNRAAAYTALGKKTPAMLQKAIADARMAARLQPDFAKAYLRLGTALSMSKQYEEAVQAFASGLSKDPSSRPHARRAVCGAEVRE